MSRLISKSYSQNKKRSVAAKTFHFSSSDEEVAECEDARECKEIKADDASVLHDLSQDVSYSFNNNNIKPNFNLESSFISMHDSPELSGADMSFLNKQLTINSSAAINTTTAKNPIQDSSLVNSIFNSYTQTSKSIIQTRFSDDYPVDNGSCVLETNSPSENDVSVLRDSSVLREIEQVNVKDSSNSTKSHKKYLKNRYKRFKKAHYKKDERSDAEENSDGFNDKELDVYSNKLIEDISASILTAPEEIQVVENDADEIVSSKNDGDEKELSNNIGDEIVSSDNIYDAKPSFKNDTEELDNAGSFNTRPKFKSQKSILKTFIKQNVSDISKQDHDVLLYSLGQVRDDLLRHDSAENTTAPKNDDDLFDQPSLKQPSSRENFALERRSVHFHNYTDDLAEILCETKLPHNATGINSAEEWKNLVYRLHRLVYAFVEEDLFLKYIEMYEKDAVVKFLRMVLQLDANTSRVAEFAKSLAKSIIEKDFGMEPNVECNMSEDLIAYLSKIKAGFETNRERFKRGITGLYLEQELFILENYFEAAS